MTAPGKGFGEVDLRSSSTEEKPLELESSADPANDPRRSPDQQDSGSHKEIKPGGPTSSHTRGNTPARVGSSTPAKLRYALPSRARAKKSTGAKNMRLFLLIAIAIACLVGIGAGVTYWRGQVKQEKKKTVFKQVQPGGLERLKEEALSKPGGEPPL